MRNRIPVFIYPLVINIVFALMLSGCAVDETARVTINLGLDAHARHGERSVFDRVLAFLSLAREAEAAPPANITGIELYVSGPGMSEERHLFSPTTTKLSVIAPAGNKRTFLVIARIDPSDPRAVLAYGGSATVSLKGGDDITLNIRMVTYETKLVIPNADPSGNLVVQINDMTGAVWTTYNDGSYTHAYDIDFDAKGRIYIGYRNSAMVRIDDISGVTGRIEYSGGPVGSIVVDQLNDIVYSVASPPSVSLRWHDINDETFPHFLTTTGIDYVRGMCLHPDGNLVLACSYDPDGAGSQPSLYSIVKYSPQSQSAVFSNYGDPNIIHSLWDIRIAGSSIYVLHGNSGSTVEVMKYDLDLNFIGKAGSAAGDINTRVTPPMVFFFPHRFIAVLNRRITLVDDDHSGSNHHDRLVQFSDVDGSDWSIYGDYSSGLGIGLFNFYS